MYKYIYYYVLYTNPHQLHHPQSFLLKETPFLRRSMPSWTPCESPPKGPRNSLPVGEPFGEVGNV